VTVDVEDRPHGRVTVKSNARGSPTDIAFHAVTEYDLASGAGRVVGMGIGPPTPSLL